MFDNIKTKYEDSEFIINEENSKTAINIIKDKIKKNGETAELYCYLSKAVLPFYPKKALKYAKKAVKLDRNYLYAKARLMYSYAMLCKKKQTLKLTDEILKADNINLYIYYLICKAFNNIGIDEKDEKYNKVLKILANSDNIPSNRLEYEYKLLSCIGLKEYKLFEKYLKEAEEKNFLTSLTYCTISKFYFNKKQYDEALEYTDKALEIDITCEYAYFRKAAIFYKLKKYDATYAVITNYGDYDEEFLNESSSILNTCNFILIGLNYIVKCLVYYFSCHLFKKSNIQKRLIFLLDKEKKNTYIPELYCMISDLYIETENYKKALIYVDKSIAKYDNLAYAYFIKGVALRFLEDYDNALKASQIAEKFYVKLNDKDSLINVCFNISWIYYAMNEYEKSLIYANKIILINKEKSVAYYIKGCCLFDKNDYDNALNEFLKAEKLGYNSGSLYDKISISYYHKNNLKKSLEYITRAMLVDNMCSCYFLHKAKILTALGRKDEAQICLNQSEKLKNNKTINNQTNVIELFKKKGTL